MPVVKHFAPIVEGDDITSKTITLERRENNVLQSLTGATVEFELLRGKKSYLLKSEADPEITIVDAVNGVVKFGPFETDGLDPGLYYYVIRVRYSDDLEVTFVGGQMPIIEKEISKYFEVI